MGEQGAHWHESYQQREFSHLKVTVNTQLTDLRAFLEHIVAMTNMRCLTPEEALTGMFYDKT